MNQYWNKRIRKLDPYVPGEQPRDKTYIKLNTNENPYPPAPAVLDAIQKVAGDFRLYPDPGSLYLRQALAESYGLEADQFFTGNGSDEILAFCFGAFFESDRELLFPDISYSFYPVYAGLWDLPYKTPALSDDFSIKVEDFCVPCAGVVFPNPNAPTGKALALDEVLRIAAYQEKQGSVVIVDEAYVDFGAESAISAVKSHPNLLVIHTMSKSRSLAGLRVGYAAGDKGLIEALCRIRDSFNSYTLDRAALVGAEAAVRSEAYYTDINKRIIATRERCIAALNAMHFTVIPSAANFLFVKAPGVSGLNFTKGLRDRGILVRHWNKGRIADFVRVSIGTDADMDCFLAACKELI